MHIYIFMYLLIYLFMPAITGWGQAFRTASGPLKSGSPLSPSLHSPKAQSPNPNTEAPIDLPLLIRVPKFPYCSNSNFQTHNPPQTLSNGNKPQCCG